MKKKIIILLLTCLTVLSLFTACSKNESSGTSSSDASVSDEVKEPSSNSGKKEEGTTKKAESEAFFGTFESETVDGEKVDDTVLKGKKVTMVNVWGTFCSPCIREMPDLQKISKNYADKGVQVVGIVIDTYDYTLNKNSENKIDAAKDIIAQTGVEYINILPSPALNSIRLDNIFSVPTTYFLDENGAIIGTEYVGSRSYDQWCTVIDSILSAV